MIDKRGLLTLEGYASFSDNINNSYYNILHNGAQELQSINIIPKRIASLAKINFDDAKEYFGGWPEDVVGREGAKLFYLTLYKELGKMAREEIKKVK